MWDGGPVGLKDLAYPHPQGWTFEGAEQGQTMEHMTIKALTGIFRANYAKPPTCMTNWPTALGQEVPLSQAFANHSNPILTKRDSKSHFRILHRSLRTRNLAPSPPVTNEAAPNDEHLACRLCLVERERFSHIGRCYITRQVFAPLVALANAFLPVSLDEALIYIGAISPRLTVSSTRSRSPVRRAMEVLPYRPHEGRHGQPKVRTQKALARGCPARPPQIPGPSHLPDTAGYRRHRPWQVPSVPLLGDSRPPAGHDRRRRGLLDLLHPTPRVDARRGRGEH